MVKQMHLNAFTQCCIGHHSEGQWRNPAVRTADGYRNVHYWVELARTLERGFFDSLFLADVHGTYSVYKGSAKAAIENAVQIPGNDPTLVISAMAAATEHLGFACTYSTTYFPPYHTAKLFSTLDHLSGGRVGWNVVTSYLVDALANFGIKDELEHDRRYDRAEEYMSVVYKLWEHSWEEGAVVKDAGRGIFADPDRVHKIDHEGEWFSVPGPHQCEPSPQRTPVIYQAGQSGRGNAFAAKHAEAVFCVHPTIAAAEKDVRKLRDLAVEQGRRPDDIKIIQGVAVIVGLTDEEAQVKAENYRRYASRDGALALLGGWSGADLSTVEPGMRIEDSKWTAIQGLRGMLAKIDPDRKWTPEAIADYMALGSILPKIIGSPKTVADAFERWMDESDLDGFNIHAVVQPSGFTDFVDLVVPELQRRGRLRTRYEGATLRESYFGAGHPRLNRTHPAYQALPPWTFSTDN